MLYIIEGPDGSGKSTLATKLAMTTGATIVHMSQPKDNENQLEMYLNLLKQGKNLILDRAWYSEMVYGKVMRGKSEISTLDMYTLERYAAARRGGCIVIYCHTKTDEVMWLRCALRGEDYVTTEETHKRICEEYRSLFEVFQHVLPVVHYYG